VRSSSQGEPPPKPDFVAELPGSATAKAGDDRSLLAPSPQGETRDADARSTTDSVASGEVLRAKLEAVASTFLTETPDVPGLNALLAHLSQRTKVVADSVHTEPSGRVVGELTVDGTDVQMQFEIRRGEFKVLWRDQLPVMADSPYVLRDLRASFMEEGSDIAKPSAAVQYHPNSHLDPRQFLEPGQERLVGWSLITDGGPTHAVPVTMRIEPESRGWLIGRSDAVATRADAWPLDSGAMAQWHALLAPYSH
jgi:hypothetical protein